MPENSNERGPTLSWHLNQKVTIGMILTFIGWVLGSVWFAVSITSTGEQ